MGGGSGPAIGFGILLGLASVGGAYLYSALNSSDSLFNACIAGAKTDVAAKVCWEHYRPKHSSAEQQTQPIKPMQ